MLDQVASNNKVKGNIVIKFTLSFFPKRFKAVQVSECPVQIRIKLMTRFNIMAGLDVSFLLHNQ